MIIPKRHYVLVFLCMICFDVLPQKQIVVIADTQQPLRVEMLWSEAERNEEATSVLFGHLLKERAAALFMLGDLVAVGSSDEQWVPVEYFVAAMRRKNIGVYAIPGNHEYSFPAGEGIADFYKRFPRARAPVQVHTINAVAMVLVDGNYGKLSRRQEKEQAERYRHCMDSLQNDASVRAIIVCTHQSPYTNSTGIRPDKEVQKRLVSAYIATPKAVLFLSGHSHNLERFREQGKDFLVIGGGGGLKQPLLAPEKRRYHDLISDNERLRFFYLIIERVGEALVVHAKGMQADDFTKTIEEEVVRIELGDSE